MSEEHRSYDPVEPQSDGSGTVSDEELRRFIEEEDIDGLAEEFAPESAGGTAGSAKEKSGRKEKIITTENLEKLLGFDRDVIISTSKKSPVEVLIGTDEVGRGCLAGPVVAAAVILPPIDPKSELAMQIARLNDSKLVPPDHRAKLAAVLRDICQYAIGEATVEEIDEINILNASLLAMRRAVRRLKVEAPALVVIDGNKKIRSKLYEQLTVIGGDSKSASIAAASIIAKVHRDTFMCKLAKKFPHYLWHSNKGYQSKDHWSAINEHGMTKWHRRSFCDHWLQKPDETEESQD